MLSIVPVIFFFIILLIFQKRQVIPSWRVSFLSAALVWGILLTAITEFLSLFRAIDVLGVSILWISSTVLALVYFFKTYNNTKRLTLHLHFDDISRFEFCLLTGIVFIVVAVGSIGLISPPNSYDSMTYHMSRVVHWIQNRSVAHYPTSIIRQLYLGPWAEFAIMHFQILSNSDRFANLIQWFSLLGSALGASLLAKQLGANLRGEILASVISITIPMGILQGSSTQNDYVVSFWLVCFTYFAVLLMRNGRPLYSLAVGASLGLAILTKATSYIYAFPFMVWLGLSLTKSRGTKGLLLIVLTGITAISINIGHYSRNYNLYENPLGTDQSLYSNSKFAISYTISNAIRNIGLHINTPSKHLNALLEDGIYQLHKIIKVDPNDHNSTFGDTKFHTLFSFHEDLAGNPLHLILITISTLVILLRQSKQKDTTYYLVCLTGAFILFSAYLRWQPWNSRLHLPFFVLWSPIVGISLSKIKFRKTVNLIIAFLLLGGLPYVLQNESRPLIGQNNIIFTSRTKLYFKNYPSIEEPYISSTQFILKSQCTNIGLILSKDSWEYPFWALLNQYDKHVVRLEHVNVKNISKMKADKFNTFIPCAIILVSKNPPDEIHISNATYLRKTLNAPVSVFMSK